MIINILNDKVVWKLLLLISYEPGRGYYFKDFKQTLKMNNSSLYKVINKLKFYNILTQNNNIYKLNFENNDTNILIEIMENDKKKFNKINSNAIMPIIDFLSYIDKNINIQKIILFGSYAKRTNKNSSDIDIAIVSIKKEDFFEYIYKIEQQYNTKLEIHQFTQQEFENNNSKLISEIKRDGINLI